MSPELYRDRYEPVALAGRGAQGEVWLARDHVHDRPVALKIRDTVAIDRDALLGEARTLLAMRPHDGLPLVRDDFFAEDPVTGRERYVVTMDWIEGRNLASTRDLTFEEILGHLRAVAEALDHLHTHVPPIVHRDVKPQNVVLSDNGRTVLVDFGLAGATAGPRYLDGTPGYLAPEVAAGGAATPASDVFALAVTAFVTITGDLPTPGRAPDLAIVPERWRDQVQRALADGLAFDPRDRPRSAGELVRSMSPTDAPNNLPAALSSFVGRDAETMDLSRLLSSSRLVTLVGTGGSGKTRLALRVAERAQTSYPDGTWVAELAGIVDPDLLTSRVAHALGVRTDGGRDTAEALRDFLDGSTLLVLDNCEHVIDACAHLVEGLLRGCPRLTILATSREPIRAAGEVVVDVAPLDDGDAATLFLARVPPGVRVAPDDERVIDLCRLLEGVPLALELAAAQLRSIGLDDLTTALHGSLAVLTGGARTNPRQETMHATIAWSHELLTADAQRALARLSVFVGGFTEQAASEVAGAADQLVRLVDASLVTTVGQRFRMLEPIRQFAEAQLVDAGGLDAYREAHAHWVLDLTERDETITPEYVHRLAADHDNLEAALTHAIAHDPATAGEIARRAVLYWTHTGYWVQGRMWVLRALESDALSDPLRAELLNRAGDMSRNQGHLDESERQLEGSVALFRQLGDDRALGMALLGLGLTAYAKGDMERSKGHQLEASDLSARAGNVRGHAMALNNLALVHDGLGEITEAIDVLERAVQMQTDSGGQLPAAFTQLNLAAMHRKLGDNITARRLLDESLATTTAAEHVYGRVVALNDLAAIDLLEGDPETASARASEAMELARKHNDTSSVGFSLHILAGVAEHAGDLDRASALHAEAVDLRREVGAPLELATSLDQAAVVDVRRGDHAVAVRRLAEADALRVAAGVPRERRPEAELALEEARSALGDVAFERELERGRRDAGR